MKILLIGMLITLFSICFSFCATRKYSAFSWSSVVEFFIHSFIHTLTKKILCVFLVGIMFFNGFVPKSQEIKENFFVALNCVMHSTMIKFCNDCRNAVTLISSGIEQKLFEMFMTQEGIIAVKDNRKTNKQSPIPVNTSQESEIITQRTITEQIEFSIIKPTAVYVSVNSMNDLYLLYNNIKTYPGNNKATIPIFVLLMILFSIYVVRIKDVINNTLKKYICKCNTRPACAI